MAVRVFFGKRVFKSFARAKTGRLVFLLNSVSSWLHDRCRRVVRRGFLPARPLCCPWRPSEHKGSSRRDLQCVCIFPRSPVLLLSYSTSCCRVPTHSGSLLRVLQSSADIGPLLCVELISASGVRRGPALHGTQRPQHRSSERRAPQEVARALWEQPPGGPLGSSALVWSLCQGHTILISVPS